MNTYVIPKYYTNRAFQLSSELDTSSGKKIAVNSVANLVYGWIKEKFPDMPLQECVNTVDIRKAGISINIIYDSGEYFCCNVEHPDENVAGRIWKVEVEVIEFNEKIIFGVKITYTTLKKGKDDGVIFSIPKFVISISREMGFSDVRELNNSVLEVNTDAALDELFSLLTDKNRIFPVIVITDRSNYEVNSESNPLIKPSLLLASIGIVAHIVHLSNNMDRKWTDIVGSEWGVYDGAIRTYYANIDFSNMDYYLHPLVTAKRIWAYGYTDDRKEHRGEDVFHELIIEIIKKRNTTLRIDWKARGHNFWLVAMRDRFRTAMKKVDDCSTCQKAHEEEFFQWIKEIDEKDDEIQSVKQSEEAAKEEIKNLQEIIRNQNIRIIYLQDELRKETEDVIPVNDDYSSLVKWARKYLSGTLLLLPRAIRSLKKAEFEDVQLVYRSLILLGEEYYKMRVGIIDQLSFTYKCRELGVEDGITISESRAGEEKESYYVEYEGANKLLNRHLKKGVSRNPKHCMRIYYFWDDEKDLVVVGSLPGHLDTRTT